VDLRAGLDDLEKRKFFTLPGINFGGTKLKINYIWGYANKNGSFLSFRKFKLRSWTPYNQSVVQFFQLVRISLDNCLHSHTTKVSMMRALPGKLTVTQPVKKCIVLYGTKVFITAFTRARRTQINPARILISHF
jgi:hypothetical protein